MFFVRCIRVKLFLVFIAVCFITAVLVQHVRRLRAFSSFERKLEAEEILPFPEDISLFYNYPCIRPHSIREKRKERLLLALKKQQTIPLLSSKDYDLNAMPYRNDKGIYALELYSYTRAQGISPIGSLYFPTAHAPCVFYINDKGCFVNATNDWTCALALSHSAEGLVAWRNTQSPTNFLPHPQGYRRFYLRGRKPSFGLFLLHERLE